MIPNLNYRLSRLLYTTSNLDYPNQGCKKPVFLYKKEQGKQIFGKKPGIIF